MAGCPTRAKPMEKIRLTPHLGVDPMQPLRSPGDVLLRDYMIPGRLNAAQLARRTGISSRHLKAFVTNTRAISPAHARRLAAVLDTSAFYWLALQARYDLEGE